ncbi:MAG: fumarylacetoacetate hydrolase family protein [Pararhodobacter sp.]
MRLIRHGTPGNERPGMLAPDGTRRDLSAVIEDLRGAALGDESLARLRELDPTTLPLVDNKARLGPPVAGIGKFICIGLNYADHAAEAGMSVPSEPIIFMKATSAVSGPHDPLEIPRGSTRTDWEVELGVVIGKRAKYIEQDQALEHIAGYLCVNDVSERDFQTQRQGQWTKGKSHDTFGPIGPWLCTRDEIVDPQALRLWCDIDGQRRQDGSTATMVYGVTHLIAYLSRFMTLEPGDIIATGTPPGVGMGLKPPVFLQPGQEISLGVEGLGEQSYRCVPA